MAAAAATAVVVVSVVVVIVVVVGGGECGGAVVVINVVIASAAGVDLQQYSMYAYSDIDCSRSNSDRNDTHDVFTESIYLIFIAIFCVCSGYMSYDLM